MKTKFLTLNQIFALYKELSKDMNIKLHESVMFKVSDKCLYKQLNILEKDEVIFKSKWYKRNYFNKQLTNFLKSEELPY